MKPSEVRKAIAAAVAAVRPDGRATKRDVFVWRKTEGREAPQKALDRSFVLSLVGQPSRDNITCEIWRIEWQLDVHYQAQRDVEARVADDSPLIQRALEGLKAIDGIEGRNVEPAGIEENDGALTSSWSVIITYQGA